MSEKHAADTVCVVALGASAGGLEAFEEFFTNLPPSPGCAFVLVMHLDPNHKSMLPELLGKVTDMSVVQAEEGMKLMPNQIHVIPPNASMRVKNGMLHLSKPEERRGARRPIDEFFRSLAEETRDHTVGIIFSGTGSDGALGLKEIKFAGGLAMIQEPSTAKFDSMPMAARHAGAADVALPPSGLAARLADFLDKHGAVLPEPDSHLSPDADALEQILAEVRRQTGRDLTSYKRTTLRRRVEKRLLLRERENLDQYRKLLESDDEEVQILLKEMLIGVTSFFRDAEAFQALEEHVLPEIFKAKPGKDPVRIWVPGCSTGEEVYSLAMLIHSYQDKRKDRRGLQIFGTDVDEEAIQKARTGRYQASAVEDIPLPYRQRYLRRDNGQFTIASSIRESVVFAPHDLVANPPFFRLDLISCRNLLIYLTNEAQKKVVPLFAYALNLGGFLLLGPSETLGPFAKYFKTIDNKWKIYERKEVPASRVDVPLTSAAPWRGRFASTDQDAGKRPDARSILRDAITSQFGPPSVLVNDSDEIIQIHGDVSPFLGLAEGDPSRDVYSAARKYIRPHVRSAMHKARNDGEGVSYSGIRSESGDDYLSLMAAPVKISGKHQFLLLSFVAEQNKCTDEALPPIPVDEARDQLVKQLEDELQDTSDKLQTTVEDLESANEELKSSNEELMSMNEELQSSNEELETSQEELQALNEELSTVNAELQAKITELDEAKSDLENILRSSDIATIFIDRDLVIRQFTPAAKQFFHLEPTDIGRSLSHFSSTAQHADIIGWSKGVMKNLTPREEEVATQNGRQYLLRIYPYRTLEETIEGVVLTFVDITDRKAMEETLRISNERLALALSATGVGVYDHNVPLDNSAYYSDEWADLLGFRKEELPDQEHFMSWLSERVHPDDRDALNKKYERFVSGESQTCDVEIRLQRKDGEYIWGRGVSRAVSRDKNGRATRVVGLMMDVTKHKEIESELECRVNERTQQLNAILSSVQDYLYFLDKDGRFIFANKKLLELWGKDESEAVGKTMKELGYDKEVEKSLQGGADEVFRTGKMVKNVTHYTSPTGVVGSYENILAPVLNEDGKVEFVAGSSRDITDRIQAEEELRTLAAELESSNNEAQRRAFQLEATIRSMHDGVIVYANDGSVQMINDPAMRIFERDREFFDKPRKERWKHFNISRNGEQITPDEIALGRALRGKTMDSDTVTIQFESGKTIQLNINAAPVHDVDGGQIGAVAVLRDITKQLAHEKDLFEAKEQAQAANEAKSAFLANMSHELRTPLAGMLGMIDLISSERELAQVKEYANLATQAGKQLQVILNDILELAQIEADRVILSQETTNLRTLIDEVCGIQRVYASSKGVSLTCGCSNEVPETIVTDDKRVHQILSNLVNNAIKYTNDGRIELIVDLLPGETPQVRFQIVDTGVGMSSDEISRIFDKFYQAENYLTKANKGVGLGLTITQKLVELLDGEIQVESEPGKGSTFTVILPIKRDKRRKNTGRAKGAQRGAVASLRILLVEDNPINLKYLQQVLEQNGHSVTTAANGEKGVNILSKEAFDVVLMDVQMPVLDGVEATRHIRSSKDQRVRETKIIGLTAYAMPDQIDEFMEAGMDGYVSKPVDLNKLNSMIRELLAK
ncbi:CheR family methyltransferase [Oceanidesulfovibrio marinus]|uniref:histidine kinase n=1 Tax=Oceanidesulfovibrio marinus TaxID=370038 RepID=A0ABX6NG36_9BACT|nr:CheR family methyltransferase [Oceanidesulfovibrio marinus]QJT09008.1 PAS domain S-box protein [Oceanidesulfovibrio marinus]